MVITLPTLDSDIVAYIGDGVLLRQGHFAYPSGRHSSIHLDHDQLLTDPEMSSRMGYALAKAFFTAKVDTIAAPSYWGAGLAQWVGYFLEPRARVVYPTRQPDGSRRIVPRLHPLINGKRILIVDNVTLSGETVKRFSDMIAGLGGEVLGVGCLWAAAVDINGPSVVGLLNGLYPSWSTSECPLCRNGQHDVETISV